ncbi:hypothetical protein ACHWQZ_G010997 [Mnemiopsis leidyi]
MTKKFSCTSNIVLIITTINLTCCFESNLNNELSCKSAQGHATMGFVISDIGDIRDIGPEKVQLIRSKLLEHAVVVVKNQTLTRKDQIDLSSKLGKIIVLPPSLEGNDPEPGYPAIQRVTNFFHNRTWKGKTHCFGCYWHKDGDFQENGFMFSLLYADQVANNKSSTNFLDNCEVLEKLNKSTLQVLSDTVFAISVRDIPDFVNATEKDYLLFPKNKRYNGIYTHPGNGRKCAYVTGDLITDAGYAPQLKPIFEEVTEKSVKYRHYWEQGDIVIWDNLGVMHRAGSKGGGAGPEDRTPRMLFRTQSWI